MYKITNNNSGQEIGVTESLWYVRRNPVSGALIQASKENAEGIAFNGVWNIFPNELLEGDDISGMCTITEIDVTDYFNTILQNKAHIDYVAMMADIPLEDEEEQLAEEE